MDIFDIPLDALGVDAKANIIETIDAALAAGPKTGVVVAHPYVEDGVLRLKGRAFSGKAAEQIIQQVQAAKQESAT